MASHNSKKVICPFYRTDTLESISCEGMKPGTGLRMTFRGRGLCRTYLEDYCCNSYWDCDIAHMLECKYGDF